MKNNKICHYISNRIILLSFICGLISCQIFAQPSNCLDDPICDLVEPSELTEANISDPDNPHNSNLIEIKLPHFTLSQTNISNKNCAIGKVNVENNLIVDCQASGLSVSEAKVCALGCTFINIGQYYSGKIEISADILSEKNITNIYQSGNENTIINLDFDIIIPIDYLSTQSNFLSNLQNISNIEQSSLISTSSNNNQSDFHACNYVAELKKESVIITNVVCNIRNDTNIVANTVENLSEYQDILNQQNTQEVTEIVPLTGGWDDQWLAECNSTTVAQLNLGTITGVGDVPSNIYDNEVGAVPGGIYPIATNYCRDIVMRLNNFTLPLYEIEVRATTLFKCPTGKNSGSTFIYCYYSIGNIRNYFGLEQCDVNNQDMLIEAYNNMCEKEGGVQIHPSAPSRNYELSSFVCEKSSDTSSITPLQYIQDNEDDCKNWCDTYGKACKAYAYNSVSKQCLLLYEDDVNDCPTGNIVAQNTDDWVQYQNIENYLTTVSEEYKLSAGETLEPEQYLCSPNHKLKLKYQNDGNLVLYEAKDNNNGQQFLWGIQNISGYNNLEQAQRRVEMQSNGVLEVRDNSDVSWSKPEVADAVSSSYLIITNTGKLAIYDDSNIPVWISDDINSSALSYTFSDCP